MKFNTEKFLDKLIITANKNHFNKINDYNYLCDYSNINKRLFSCFFSYPNEKLKKYLGISRTELVALIK